MCVLKFKYQLLTNTGVGSIGINSSCKQYSMPGIELLHGIKYLSNYKLY